MTHGRGFLWLLAGLVSAAPSAATGQNLDAGKSPAQIFQEDCADCHRNARTLRSRATTSFLREHYTTGSAMASAMASYLAGGSSSDPRATLPQVQRPPRGPAPADGFIPRLLRGLVPADAAPRPARAPAPAEAITPRRSATAVETRETAGPSKSAPPPLEAFEE